MKIKFAFVAGLITAGTCWTASSTMAGPPQKIMVENYRSDFRSGSLDFQTDASENLLRKVSKVSGKPADSVSIVPSDPNELKAQIAEATGDAKFCGETVGTLNIIEQDDQKYLVGNAHSFYEEGNLICDDKFGYIMPDVHYGKSNEYGIDFVKKYKFEMPPLNHSEAKKYNTYLTDLDSVRDFVILKILDESLFQRQVGGTRRFIKLFNGDHTVLKEYGGKNAFLISRRINFHDFKEVSIETGCRIGDFIVNGKLVKIKKHSCDTGKNSSGSSINTMYKNQLYSLGIHYGGSTPKIENGIGSSIWEILNEYSKKGNFFIPPQEIIRTIKKISGAESL